MAQYPEPPEHRLAYPHVEVGARIHGDKTFVTDAVVVGTGAGGATAAARLREAGLDVIMLEEGALHLPSSFTTDAPTMIRRLYRDAGTTLIFGRPGIIFAEGRCVGGSTVINGGMCWRAPKRILDLWERDLGLPDTGPRAMEPYFDQAERILHVEPQSPDTLGKHSLAFLRGATALGWPAVPNRRNMRRCMGLNNCTLGCPTGAKQAMHVTEVPRALAAGATLVTHARVDRVLWQGTRAVGVAGRLLGEDDRPRGRFRAYARLVVLAAGARHTPGILKRSRLRARAIGRGLHVHPNAKVIGVFPDSLDPWIGAHQTHQIHHFLDDGIVIGYGGIQPGILAVGVPGIAEESARRMSEYNCMLPTAALIEDTAEGRVVLGPDRQPYMFFTPSQQDVAKIHRGVTLAAELLFAAGARTVILPFAELPLLDRAEDLGKISDRPLRSSGIELMTVHIMGSCRMSRDPGAGATDASGAVHGVTGLVVADASVLPSSVAVNPQETIVAMALRNAERWLRPVRPPRASSTTKAAVL